MTITLATLSKATEQQVFDQVARHLLKQGKRAMSDNGSCKYRAGNGLMCAAGCLIADDEYHAKYDVRGGWLSVVEAYPHEVPSAHQNLIASLQGLHDSHPGHYPGDRLKMTINYADRLERFAELRNLNFNLQELQA